MRYILDSKGYIEETTFGGIIICNDKECTEYVGSIPEGYDSLEDWNENATIQAYKIVNGNLVFDEERELELIQQQEKEDEENQFVTYGELTKSFQTSAEQFADMYKELETPQDRIVTSSNSKAFPIKKITINPRTLITDKVDVIVTNKNILKNDAISETIDNLVFKVDRTKRVNVTNVPDMATTRDVQYTICGNELNTEPIFLFKKDVDYCVHQSGCDLVLYNYDGVDREEIYRGSNWATIRFSEDKPVTHAVFEIAEGTYIMPHDVYYPLQIELGSVSTDYAISEYNKITINLEDKEFTKNGAFVGENTIAGETTIIKESTLDTILYDEGYIELIRGNEIFALEGGTLNSFSDTMTAFTIQDTTLKVEYKANILSGDTQGSIYNDDMIEVAGSVGVLSNLQFQSGNEYSFIGHEFTYSPQRGNYYKRTGLTLHVDIPQNFSVVSAVITLKHNNVWCNNNGSNFYGYSRNIKLYKGDNYSSIRSYVGGASYINESDDYEEIYGAFGEDGYTPPTPTDTDAYGTTIYSNNLRNELTTGTNTLVIRSGDTLTDNTSTEQDAAEQTGWCYAYINIIGYININKEVE